MLSFAQELSRNERREIIGYHWIGLLICDHCRRHVRKTSATVGSPDILPTTRFLYEIRQIARDKGWALASAAIPGDYCSRCILLWRPAGNDPAAAPLIPLRAVPATKEITCENCGTALPAGKARFCGNKCQAEARLDRLRLERQNERSKPRACTDCGAIYRHDGERGIVPVRCPLCRARRKRH